MSEDRANYQEKAENEFNRLAEQLGRFMARVEVRARKEYDTVNRELGSKKKVVSERLGGLKGASSGAWQDLKPGFESAWTDLREAFAKARTRFSEADSAEDEGA